MDKLKPSAVFAAAVADANNLIIRARETRAILRKKQRKIEKLITPVSLIISGSGHKDVNIEVNIEKPETLYFYVFMYRLESFKAPVLTAVLEYFNEIADECSTTDWADTLNRDYRFVLPGGNRALVAAYVRSDSPTCRKVPVGIEKVDHVKYEIQCD